MTDHHSFVLLNVYFPNIYQYLSHNGLQESQLKMKHTHVERKIKKIKTN